MLGRAVRWWFPGRVFGLGHKGPWNRTSTGGRIVSVEPIFIVADVSRAVAHYKRLGFNTAYHDAGYAFANRGDVTIHLAGTEGQLAGGGAIYLHVDDADSLATDWRKAGVEVSGPENFDWGKREGRHVDPDGNVIRFGSPLRR